MSTQSYSTESPFPGFVDERTLWIAALLFYGIGDTTTTYWGLSTTGVEEIGPIAGPLMDAYGYVTLLLIKLVIFVGCYAAWSALKTPGRAAIPLALVVVGIGVTIWNLLVILVF